MRINNVPRSNNENGKLLSFSSDDEIYRMEMEFFR